MLEPTDQQPPSVTLGRRHVATSVAVLAIGDLINKIARFAAVIVLTHALALGEYGLLNLGLAIGGIAVVLLRLGLPDVGAREVAIAPDRREELAGRIITPQAGGMLAITATAAAAALVVAPQAVGFVLLSGASTFGLALSAEWLLRGMERMLQLALAIAAGGVVTLVGAIVVAVTSANAAAGLVALGIGELCAAAWTLWAARLRSMPRPTLRGLGSLLRESWPLAVSGAATYAFQANVDTVLLAATRSVEEAGLYAAPYRLFLALSTTAIFAAYALLPLASRAIAVGKTEHAERVMLSFLPLLAGLTLLWLAIAELFAGELLAFFFGAPFGAMGPTFILLTAAAPWYAVGYPVGYVSIAAGRQHRLMAGAAVAAAVNLVLNVLLIPPLGPEGAALATLFAMIAASLMWLSSQRLLPRVAPLMTVLALATLGAGLASALEQSQLALGALTLATAVAMFARGSYEAIATHLRRRTAR